MHDSDPDADALGGVTPFDSDSVLQQTNKRHTLNLLIQGAAAHAFLTAHHLVKDELEAIRPGLTHLYDRAAVSLLLGYWLGDIPLLQRSWRFWRRSHLPSHPFHRHDLLARYGAELSNASKRYLLARASRKSIIGIPVVHFLQMLLLVARVAWIERRHKPQLACIAKTAISRIWGIDKDRLSATLTTEVAIGPTRIPNTRVGRMIQTGAVGYGGVKWRDNRFMVVAKAWIWPLVAHELIKGTAELVCLHGLNTLDAATYESVTSEADQIEYETWMLQAGSETWRRLLLALPERSDLPEMLMHIARLDPQSLERLMLAVVNDRAEARNLLERISEN